MSIFLNPSAQSWNCQRSENGAVSRFHRQLPEFAETPLVALPELAKELGVGHVLVKDESFRLGLPAFKILGASWAVYRAVAEEVNLPPTVSLEELGEKASKKPVHLVTCTDGNWGRAVSRMAKYLGIQALIYVPQNMDQATKDKIASEGATVAVVPGDYDASIRASIEDSKSHGHLLVMDTSWPGYEQVPTWVVEGYSTAFEEVDRQLEAMVGRPASCAIASVGVGSWAHSVVNHFKSQKPSAAVVTVEPETAACLMASLRASDIVPIETGDTIMCGMNCGTVSTIAWQVLKDAVDATISISDHEAHEAVLYLLDHGINAGPCGAAPLVALRKSVEHNVLNFGPDSVMVLFCSEGARPYVVPSP